MSKTIKQIADELQIPKQRVYRYIKSNHIKEEHQENGVMYYDVMAEMAIKYAFLQRTVSDETSETHQNHTHIDDTAFQAVVDVLTKQLEAKDRQIEQLQRTVEQLTTALTAAQALNAADKQQLLQLEDKHTHTSLWNRIFGKKENQFPSGE